MGLVRLFLALVVAADHWWAFVLAPKGLTFHDGYKFGFNSGYAVMFFYVISGFLITYTLTRNYQLDAAGMTAFYRNRFVRIFSLYWPMVVLAFLFYPGSWAQFVAADIGNQLTGIFLIGMDWSVAFSPTPNARYSGTIEGLHQAWTLGAELVFYLAAPLLLRSWKIALALLLASFGLRAGFVYALGPGLHETWTYHFAVTTFGFFLLGHLVCLARRPLAQPLLGLLLLFASFSVMLFGNMLSPYESPRFWGSVLLFTLALPGLFEATKNIRWMNRLGDLSYPTYLVHTLVMAQVGPYLLGYLLSDEPIGRPAGYLSVACFLAAATLAAFLVHRLVEEPVARVMRMVLAGRKILPA